MNLILRLIPTPAQTATPLQRELYSQLFDGCYDAPIPQLSEGADEVPQDEWDSYMNQLELWAFNYERRLHHANVP